MHLPPLPNDTDNEVIQSPDSVFVLEKRKRRQIRAPPPERPQIALCHRRQVQFWKCLNSVLKLI